MSHFQPTDLKKFTFVSNAASASPSQIKPIMTKQDNIVLPDYPFSYSLLPVERTDLKEYNDVIPSKQVDKNATYGYGVFWGGYGAIQPQRYDKYGIMETGFFNQGVFIDTVGDYQTMSLNSKAGYDAVENFDLRGRKSAREIIASLPVGKRSKYNPKSGDDISWEGPVLACQAPGDRSILRVSTTRKYYEFIERACRYYGKDLFVKAHPWNSNEIYDKLGSIAKKYGCEFGKTHLELIDNARFVIAYNSTFAVDCMMRGVPYAQYERGTFYNTYGITYTGQTLPDEVPPPQDYEKLPNFLIHKYSFYSKMDKAKFIDMLRHYANSNEIFPMTDEYSYATNIMFEADRFTIGGHAMITHTDEGALRFLKTKFNVKTMLDIGCGPGGQVAVAKKIGINALGIDGDTSLQTLDNAPTLCDFRTDTFHSDTRFDLGWSVEFLGNVREEHQDNYMKAFSLCDYVCVTADSHTSNNKYHHNVKPKEYWVSVFEKHGFEYDEDTTTQAKGASTMNRPFLRRSGMIFKRKGL